MTWAFSELTVAAWTLGENSGLRVGAVPLCSLIDSSCAPCEVSRTAAMISVYRNSSSSQPQSRTGFKSLSCDCRVRHCSRALFVSQDLCETVLRLLTLKPWPFISTNPLLSLRVQYKTHILAIYPPKYCKCTALQLQLPHGCTPAHITLII